MPRSSAAPAPPRPAPEPAPGPGATPGPRDVARALGAAVAYGRAARAVRASPHTLSRLVREAPAASEAVRRACVWAALAAYFGERSAGRAEGRPRRAGRASA